MHHASTVVGGHIVAWNHAEAVVVAHNLVVHLVHRFHPGEELVVVETEQVVAVELSNHLVGNHLVAGLVAVERQFGTLGLEIGIDASLGHEVDARFAVIGVVALERHIVDLRTHAQGGVAGQGPGCGGPCQHIEVLEASVGLVHDGLHHRMVLNRHGELCSHCLVLHIAVTAGHVKLVRAESGAGSGRIGLNGVALIEQALVVELLEQIPQGFDIAILIGDIGVVHVDPIAHLVREFFPLVGVFHHLLAAGGIVVVYANLLANILLGDTERFFHAELHGQSMSIPASLAQHLVALHGLEAAHDVLEGACHHMVNAGHTVGRRRSLIKHKGGSTFALLDAACKHVLRVPLFQDVFIHVREVEFAIFVEFLHIVFVRFYSLLQAVLIAFFKIMCKVTKNLGTIALPEAIILVFWVHLGWMRYAGSMGNLGKLRFHFI